MTLPTPYFETENGVLYCGDCLNILPHLGPIDLVLTDPPYGCNNNCDYTRFSGGLSPSKNYHAGIAGDDKPFNPEPFLCFREVLLFGYQFFASKLPVGTILIWNKKRESQLGTFLSDCELAWLIAAVGVICLIMFGMVLIGNMKKGSLFILRKNLLI